MRKTVFLFSLLLLLIIAGCNKPVAREESPISNNLLPAQVSQDIKASAQVDYIEFEATVVSQENINGLNEDFGNAFNKSALASSSLILLTGNNHRSDLAVFNYKELAKLDGESAQSWQELESLMGGHHISGLLAFPKNDKPKSLLISGLPVGDAILNF